MFSLWAANYSLMVLFGLILIPWAIFYLSSETKGYALALWVWVVLTLVEQEQEAAVYEASYDYGWSTFASSDCAGDRVYLLGTL